MNTPTPIRPKDATEAEQETPAGLRVWPATQLVPDVHAESYRVPDVEHLLGIPSDVIRHAIQAGDLQAVQVGHDVLGIRRTDLLAWLAARGPGI